MLFFEDFFPVFAERKNVLGETACMCAGWLLLVTAQTEEYCVG